MTLLHMDSFQLGDHAFRYAGVSLTRQTSSPRFTSGAHVQSSGSALAAKTFTAASEIVSGIAFNTDSGAAQMSFWGDTNATQHITVMYTSAGNIEVRRGNTGGTLLATASTGLVHLTTWNYLEARVTINDSTGTVKIRMNGATTDLISFTGDTKNGGTNTTIDAVRVGGASQARFCDWYILNTSGSLNNSWLGDVRIYPLAPTGNGNYSQFVGSDGNSTDNYLLVDEQPYSASDYVGAATSGDRDTYAMTDLPSGVTAVYATQECSLALKSDAGAKTLKQSLRISGTDFETSATALGTSVGALYSLRETNPNTTAAWTASEVNGTESGVRVG